MKKVVFSVYLEEDLRKRLLDLASKRQVEEGRRVSVNSVVVEAIESYLTMFNGKRTEEKTGGEDPIGDPPPDETS
jgi:hypothetical protein